MAETFEKKLYVGIDLDGDAAMVSFSYGNEEPQTVSPLAGSEIFSIPMAVALRKDGSWAYGEEARRIAQAGVGTLVDQLLVRALNGEQVTLGEHVFSLTELLARFLKKLVSMAGRLGPKASLECLVLTTGRLDEPMIRLLQTCVSFMELPAEKVHLIDHKDSFFYYGTHQPPELSTHDIGLFDCDREGIHFWCLQKEQPTKPQLMNIREEHYGFDLQQADEIFAHLIPQAFGKQIISSVYLVGDEFSGGWMKQSLQLLCQGRRVFLGKNLFSKGACFAAMSLSDSHPAKYIYFGTHTIKCNVSLKVYERGDMSFFTLITAGKPWYEGSCSAELILDGTPTVDFWIQQPFDRQARIESVELAALPQRKNKTTRIRIDAVPTSDHEVKLTLTDLGFGELVPGTGKKWEYLLCL